MVFSGVNWVFSGVIKKVRKPTDVLLNVLRTRLKKVTPAVSAIWDSVMNTAMA